MIITPLELPPEAEANLVAQAKARGLSLDFFVGTIITTQAAAIDAVKPVQSLTQEEELDRAIDELSRRSSDAVRASRREIGIDDRQSIQCNSLLQPAPSTPIGPSRSPRVTSTYSQSEQPPCFPENAVQSGNSQS
jgi:hypothetical protein